MLLEIGVPVAKTMPFPPVISSRYCERQRKMIIDQIASITQGIKELNDSNSSKEA